MRRSFLLLPLFLILAAVITWEVQGRRQFHKALEAPISPCPEAAIFKLPDGRQLSYRELGDPSSPAVFFFHGALGSRLEWPLSDAPIRAANLRLIAVDRPGYGCSTQQPGRTLAFWAEDIRQFAGSLSIPRFRVIGWSAGAIHALAVAHYLPGLVTQADTIGVSSLPEGMAGTQVRLYSFFRNYFSGNMFRLFDTLRDEWLKNPETFGDETAQQWSPSDREVFSSPAVRAQVRLANAQALKDSSAGVFEDVRVTTPPWGFQPSAIKVPVRLWHGTSDALALHQNSEALAVVIPGSQLKTITGEGHFLIYKHEAEILSPFDARKR